MEVVYGLREVEVIGNSGNLAVVVLVRDRKRES